MTRISLLRRASVLVIVIVSLASGYGQNRKPSIAISLTADKSTVEAGNPVYVEVTLKNISDHAIGVEIERVAGPEMDFDISVLGPTDKGASLTRHGRMVKGKQLPTDPPTVINGSTFLLTKEPGGTISRRIDISNLYDMTRPGTYQVQAARTDSETGLVVKSKVVTVKIVP